MIVTICGAYRNAGDHLIGKRARELLSRFVDDDIIVVDRKSISEEHIPAFNRSRAVLLCGGPAYQREMYPKIYPLEYARITSPIVPFGLGWKSAANKEPAGFKFSLEAAKFIRNIHSEIEVSSARDPLTVDVVSRLGVSNISMTGCPAWYDLATFNNDYRFTNNIRTIVLSMPAVMQPGVRQLMLWLTQRFPKARRILSFHHGVFPSNTPTGRQAAKDFLLFSGLALSKGWQIASLANNLSKMEELYDSADFHVGYRVHAHLFCLSHRVASILINEDIRGVGQASALAAPNLLVNGDNIDSITAAIDAHFEKAGQGMQRSIAIMRDTFPMMRRFLTTL